MNYLASIKSLVIYGGRDNEKRDFSPFYSDIGLLDLQSMSWVGVCTYGKNIGARSNHMAFLTGSKLIVFGGIN